MKLTGASLKRVHTALHGLRAELRNQIATCPDPEYYADALAAYAAEVKQLDLLIGRVARARAKEST